MYDKNSELLAIVKFVMTNMPSVCLKWCAVTDDLSKGSRLTGPETDVVVSTYF